MSNCAPAMSPQRSAGTPTAAASTRSEAPWTAWPAPPGSVNGPACIAPGNPEKHRSRHSVLTCVAGPGGGHPLRAPSTGDGRRPERRTCSAPGRRCQHVRTPFTKTVVNTVSNVAINIPLHWRWPPGVHRAPAHTCSRMHFGGAGPVVPVDLSSSQEMRAPRRYRN